MTVALAVVGTLLALGGLYAAYRRWGLAGTVAATVALLGGLAALLGLARRRDGPPPPPPPSEAKRTGVKARDLMHAVADREREKIDDAAGDPDRLAAEIGRQK